MNSSVTCYGSTVEALRLAAGPLYAGPQISAEELSAAAENLAGLDTSALRTAASCALGESAPQDAGRWVQEVLSSLA